MNMWKCPKYLRDLHESTFVMFFVVVGELIWKISPTGIRKILGLFLNTITVDDKYPVQDFEYL